MLLFNTPTKDKWKEQVNLSIHQHTETLWKENIASKSSLKYLNSNSVKVGKVHQIYAYVNNSTIDVRRTGMKARLLTGTYTLQSKRARFNQFKVNPQCALCKKQPEAREHFIVTCEMLKPIKTPYVCKLRTLFNCSSEINHVIESPELCVQLLLDSKKKS